ncbi:GxxExxY protein [candidate division KSB1 bacterium]|nr:GxxExxY protein [candidate division KSB1 bacterium]
MQYEDITEAILGSAFEVHNILGYGFLERVYQKSLQAELLRRGHSVEIEHAIKVKYKGVRVGDYYADLLVDNFGKERVEFNLKNSFTQRHEATKTVFIGLVECLQNA